MANAFDTVPTTEPVTLIAGDFVTWRRPDLESDYPPAEYALSYSARLDTAAATEIEATADAVAGQHTVEISAADSLAYTPGRYRWQGYMTRIADSERVTVAEGAFTVLANRDALDADQRTHARKMLDAIEAVLEKRATKDVESYSIEGRSITKMTVESLMKWRGIYRAEVANEQAAAAGKSSRQITRVRFT